LSVQQQSIMTKLGSPFEQVVRPSDDSHPARVAVDTQRISFVLFAIAAVLAVVGAFANVVIYQIADSPDADIARIMTRFDLGHEPSLPAWFSSLVLFFNSAMLILISRVKYSSKDAFSFHWLALGIIFLGLSIDESVMFHEMLDKLISFAVKTSGFLLFPWAVLGLLFALTVFIVYLKFLFHLPQRFAFLFITSGALYVGGAVGMEFIAARIIDGFGVASIYHTIVQTIEESLEMIGAILFFYSLTEYWNNRYGGMEISSPKQS